jgi:hypothetical protein
VKNSKEKTSQLDQKDLEEAEKISAKFQFKDIKDTTSNKNNRQLSSLDIQLGTTELENMKPIRHLVTQHDINQVIFF